MATTLLNPGCDPCYSCIPCNDFSGTWYIWYFDYAPSGYDSEPMAAFINAFPFWTGGYWWTTSNLANLFNNVLASFTFPGTEPSSVVGGKDKYVIPLTYYTGLEATDTLEYKRFGTPVIYRTRNIRFYDFSFEGYILYDPVTKERGLYCKTRFKVAAQSSGYSVVVPIQEFQTVSQLSGMWPCRTDPLPPLDSGNDETNYRTDDALAISHPLQVEMEGLSIDVQFPLFSGTLLPPSASATYAGRASIGTVPP